MTLTKYQQAQLLHLHLTGDLKVRNSNGNKVARSAWTKMIDSLLNGGYIDRNMKVTPLAKSFLDDNHLTINMGVLD